MANTNNATVKKQNKLLLAAILMILAAGAALVFVTGTANRKKEENPPLDNKTEETQTEKTTDGETDEKGKTKTDETAVTPSEKKDEKNRQENEKSTPDKESEKTSEIKEEVSETVSLETDILPTFSAPVNGLVLKGASLTVPVFSYTMNDYRTHTGLDFACSVGTPVLAAADGEICSVTDDPMMGVSVEVKHSGNAVTRYKGLADDTFSMTEVGKQVKAGDVIGVSGDTALIESAEENHVHFEIEVDGEIKDPAEYVSVTFLSDVTED